MNVPPLTTPSVALAASMLSIVNDPSKFSTATMPELNVMLKPVVVGTIVSTLPPGAATTEMTSPVSPTSISVSLAIKSPDTEPSSASFAPSANVIASSFATIASFTPVTVIETVAVDVAPSGSATVYVKVSTAVEPSPSVLKNALSAGEDASYVSTPFSSIVTKAPRSVVMIPVEPPPTSMPSNSTSGAASASATSSMDTTDNSLVKLSGSTSSSSVVPATPTTTLNVVVDPSVTEPTSESGVGLSLRS